MSRRDGIVKNGRIDTVANLGKSNLHRNFGHSTLRCSGRHQFNTDHTDFEALAAAWDFGTLRFSRKLANMALARAGKSRWIRSIR
jgi:hypothetical protein